MSLKIIAGKLKGVSLNVPRSARPTLSRARQCLFDMIENIVGNKEFFRNNFENIRVLDCFAGSGAIGIEFLSRNAAYSYFIDKDKTAIATLRANIAKVKMENHATIIHSDILKLPKCSEKPCDIIFLDPPFNLNIDIEKILKHLSENLWINKKSLIIVETQSEKKRSTKNKDALSQKFTESISQSEIEIIKTKTVGNISFLIFQNYQ